MDAESKAIKDPVSTEPVEGKKYDEPSNGDDSVESSLFRDLDGNSEDEIKDLDLKDTSNFSTEERNQLFQRGLTYEQIRKPQLALQCYLGCIKGLKGKTGFALLPQCLRNIADIYKEQENYEQAIRFAQAEKLLYETALVETEEIQAKLEEIKGVGDIPEDLNELNIAAMRADEYEHLAKLCLDKEQPQLALEYAGKCTKLRQQVYGDNSEKTKASLNLFATIYAEVGRSQYSESINLFGESQPIEKTPEIIHSSPAGGEPVSILRQRSVVEGLGSNSNDTSVTDREKKQVRFHVSVDETEKQKKKEELASLTINLVVLAVCFLILASMGMWLYCSLTNGKTCQQLSRQFRQWLQLFQYQFHTITSSQKPPS